jgi:hypothetical protein
MRYYVLSTPSGDELARLYGGAAAYFETTSGRWITDPLLATEVLFGGAGRELEPHELPPGITESTPQPPPARKSRWFRRGRHSRK